MKRIEFSEKERSALRAVLQALPDTVAQENLEPPRFSDIHVPQTHPKALSPDVSIVVGMRGSGKSFWTAVLAADRTRQFVSDSAALNSLKNLEVRVGFGLDQSNEQFPNASMIESLVAQGIEPICIWQAVLLRHALLASDLQPPFVNTIEAAVAWVRENRQKADSLIHQCDQRMVEKQRTLVLLFDSLDRLADDWGRIRRLLSAALRLCLECRTRKALRMKFFLRPDMVEEDDEVWRFADSSKLLHSKVELIWRPADLYGLLFLYLANSTEAGQFFRKDLEILHQVQWRAVNEVFPLPSSLLSPEAGLRDTVEAVAGPWMGTNARRGYTFTWIPTHLSDAKGRLSPRSIMLAFRHAAEWTAQFRPDCKFPLHYEGIQDGVAKASDIRIQEIKEDYPWVGPLLKALEGTTVPLTPNDLFQKWSDQCVSSAMESANREARLPPRRYTADRTKKANLAEDLIELAVLYRTEDGRLNMPDIFRVGFKIKRKGGVRPPK